MKEREKIHTDFLKDYFQHRFERNFLVLDEEPESSEIDSVIFDIEKNERINLQCVAFRGEGLIYKKPFSVNMPKDFPYPELANVVMALVPDQYDKKDSITSYINKKESKYQPQLVRELVLLIEATVPTVTPEELVGLFPNGIETRFKGIYFVQLPVPLANSDYKYDKDGFIYALKSCVK